MLTLNENTKQVVIKITLLLGQLILANFFGWYPLESEVFNNHNEIANASEMEFSSNKHVGNEKSEISESSEEENIIPISSSESSTSSNSNDGMSEPNSNSDDDDQMPNYENIDPANLQLIKLRILKKMTRRRIWSCPRRTINVEDELQTLLRRELKRRKNIPENWNNDKREKETSEAGTSDSSPRRRKQRIEMRIKKKVTMVEDEENFVEAPSIDSQENKIELTLVGDEPARTTIISTPLEEAAQDSNEREEVNESVEEINKTDEVEKVGLIPEERKDEATLVLPEAAEATDLEKLEAVKNDECVIEKSQHLSEKKKVTVEIGEDTVGPVEEKLSKRACICM